MPSSASAEKRVARPNISRIEKTCSDQVAATAAISGRDQRQRIFGAEEFYSHACRSRAAEQLDARRLGEAAEPVIGKRIGDYAIEYLQRGQPAQRGRQRRTLWATAT